MSNGEQRPSKPSSVEKGRVAPKPPKGGPSTGQGGSSGSGNSGGSSKGKK